MPIKSSSLADSKLVRTLEKISPAEMRELSKFIRSPYHVTNQKEVELFEMLEAKYPEFKEEDLEKAKFVKELFPHLKEEKALNQLTHLCRYLLQSIYAFIRLETIKLSPKLSEWILLEALNNWGIHDELQRRLSNHHQEAAFKSIYSADDYLDFFHISKLGLFSKIERNEKRDIHSVLANLDAFYLTEKLKSLCLSMQLGQTELLELFQFLATIEYIKNWQDAPILAKTYAFILQTFFELNEGNFKKAGLLYGSIKNFRAELYEAFTNSRNQNIPIRYDLLDIYRFSISIVKRLARSIEVGYKGELYTIFKEQLDSKILLDEDDTHLHHRHYKNIVTVLLKAGELYEAEELLKTYQHEITPDYQKVSYFYNQAHLSLYKNDHQAVDHFLIKLDIASAELNSKLDHVYKLGVATIKLKNYFKAFGTPIFVDKEYRKEFDRIHKNFYSQLRNGGLLLSDIEKKEYQNFIKFLNKLMKLKADKPGNMDKIKDDLEKCEIVYEREWLLNEMSTL